MVYCVAWGCQNQSKKGSGISFFRFPPEGDSRRNIWIHRCQRGEKGWTPKCTSRLCSAHFEKDAFARDPVEMAKMGYSNARISLKGTAVPTVFTNREFVENSVEMPIRRPRSAFQKRRNAEKYDNGIPRKIPCRQVALISNRVPEVIIFASLFTGSSLFSAHFVQIQSHYYR
ncbi:THAP domain-containing protein 2-like [Gigantopelta aegis]|uniref:THAP domain-containing protein 2-like n=1 Tax=Gigantopelta aegis TaxID=1735272 RepID=UPI001B88C370|nr:THAP domain-containing protein 2-like [Gigantopelta aegis]